MTKLSYAGRRTSGVKMGALIQKDIMKRISNAKTQATTKDSSLELILPGKNLGDDGFVLVCETLQEAIQCGAIHLEELNLSGNALTAISLQALSSIIRSQPDLKDLDLSKNEITVATVEDAEAWKTFLQSFENSRCLRRIDLSMNPLKDKAMEIFLGVYSSQPPLILPSHNRITSSSLSDNQCDEEESHNVTDKQENLENPKSRNGKHKRSNATGLRRLSNHSLLTKPPYRKSNAATTSEDSRVIEDSESDVTQALSIKGIRSIPYIILNNTEITDISALWLATLLPHHAKPWEILPHFPHFKDQIKQILLQKYHTDRECKGVIWTSNPGLSPHGLKALAIAEGIRGWSELDECCFTSAKTLRTSDKRKTNDSTENVFWPWSMYGPPRDTINILCDPEAPPPIYDVRSHTPLTLRNELDRTNLKIQGNVLREVGPQGVLLWHITLRMLAISRAIFFDYDGPLGDTDYHNARMHAERRSSDNSFHENTQKAITRSLKSFSLSTFNEHDTVVTGKSSPIEDFLPLSTLQTPARCRNGNSSGFPSTFSTPTTDVESSPTISLRNTQLSPRTRFFTEIEHTKDIEPMTGYMSKEIRDHRLSMKLPAYLWLRIIAMAEDPLNLTSVQQRLSIFNFARSRETLTMEREILGKLVSFQIRKVLETVDGLVYQIGE